MPCKSRRPFGLRRHGAHLRRCIAVNDAASIASAMRLASGPVALATGRNGLSSRVSSWQYASSVGAALAPPEDVYVMDVGEADGQLWLVELNPFSGADLYACPARDVVAAVSQLVSGRS